MPYLLTWLNTAYIYRLISLRYLFVLGLGFSFKAGCAFQGRYFHCDPIWDYWSNSDFCESFYRALLLVLWLEVYFLSMRPICVCYAIFMIKYGQKIPATLLSKLGVASYHIYLTQMLYFSVVAPFLAVQFKVSSLNLWNGLFTFLICLFGGYIFYKVDLFMRVRGKR